MSAANSLQRLRTWCVEMRFLRTLRRFSSVGKQRRSAAAQGAVRAHPETRPEHGTRVTLQRAHMVGPEVRCAEKDTPSLYGVPARNEQLESNHEEVSDDLELRNIPPKY